MNVKKQFFEGLITQNPVLVQLLGMCPILAITTSMFNGLGMGLSVMIILTCSNVVISALRKIIPSKVRIACYIVVNCIILGRAEGYASKNGIAGSALDGIFQGFGNMVALTIMCIIREFFGAGTFGGGILNGGKGIQIIPADAAALGMILPVGGFLTLGIFIAVVQYFMNKPKKNKEVAK